MVHHGAGWWGRVVHHGAGWWGGWSGVLDCVKLTLCLISYNCEICGNFTYKGPKAFQRHFAGNSPLPISSLDLFLLFVPRVAARARYALPRHPQHGALRQRHQHRGRHGALGEDQGEDLYIYLSFTNISRCKSSTMPGNRTTRRSTRTARATWSTRRPTRTSRGRACSRPPGLDPA